MYPIKKQMEKKRNIKNINTRYITSLCIVFLFSFVLAGCSGKSTQPVQDNMNNTNNMNNTKKTENKAQATQESPQSQPAVNIQQNTRNINKTSAQSNNKKYIGIKAAKKKALKHARLSSKKVTFTKAKLDYDDGKAEYDIKFKTKSRRYEYEINAKNGKIIKSSKKVITTHHANTQNNKLISRKKAKKTALNYSKLDIKKIKRTKIELEYENGRPEYDIEFYVNKTEYNFKVDAVTGKVIEIEIDRN